jgi:hypothetical protein
VSNTYVWNDTTRECHALDGNCDGCSIPSLRLETVKLDKQTPCRILHAVTLSLAKYGKPGEPIWREQPIKKICLDCGKWFACSRKAKTGKCRSCVNKRVCLDRLAKKKAEQ